jgi:dihydrodipicolinate synthase/N-acetylneuraminate lyase
MLQREACRGIWAPIVTPFASDRIDWHAMPAIVEWLLERGIQGLLALGTTGEAVHCSDDEAERVVAAVVRAAGGRVPVFAGSGRASTPATIETTARFARAGADAVLVLTPHAYRSRMEGAAFRRHYDAVAGASPIPVFVYHMPGMTSVELDADTLVEILAHPNIWGFKDSSTSGGPLAATLARLPVARGFVGAGSRLLDALDAGACGGILAVAHAAPEACIAIERARREGDRARAAELQALVRTLSSSWDGWAVPGVKAALAMRGVPAGTPRSPLVAPPADVQARIRAALDAVLAAT